MVWVDYSWTRPDITPFEGVIRYVDAGDGRRPDLTREEVTSIHGKGKPLALLWQKGKQDLAAGGYRLGVEHADTANRAADLLRAPETPIIYAADADYTPNLLRGYYEGVLSLAARPVALYGSHRLVEWAHNVLGIRWFMQTSSWSSGRVSGYAQFYQEKHNVTVPGGIVDLVQKRGHWPVWAPPGQAPTEEDDPVFFARHHGGAVSLVTPTGVAPVNNVDELIVLERELGIRYGPRPDVAGAWSSMSDAQFTLVMDKLRGPPRGAALPDPGGAGQ